MKYSLKKNHIFYFILLLLTGFFSCENMSSNNTPSDSNKTEVPINQLSTNPENNTDLEIAQEEDFDFETDTKYTLTKATKVLNLPEELLEISALSYNPEQKRLSTVNDEKANVYYLNIEDGSIIDKYDFGKKGDYEGVETIGETTYAIKSNGDIFTIEKNKKTEVYKTKLSTENDVEGLGYDKENKELILACKGSPKLNKNSKLKKAKAFYAFNLKTKTLVEEPKFVIKDKTLEDFFEEMPKKGLSKKGKKKLEKRLKSFSPSGIAKHPIEGHFYILSSVGRLLIVSNEKGEIQNVHFLKQKMFSQPEGICFAPDGTMYISNEGRSLVAKILVFDYLG